MITVDLLGPTDFIRAASGYSLFAELIFGTNGGMPWCPEYVTGSSAEDAVGRGAIWDDNLSDGFDTGQVFVLFDADLSTGTTSLAVGTQSATPVSYSGQSGGTIGKVVVRAGAQIESGTAEWSALTFTFWCGSTEGESVSVDGGPEAQASDWLAGVESQALEVTPDCSTYDRVTVGGTLRMQADADVYPQWTDLFGQILIMPAA